MLSAQIRTVSGLCTKTSVAFGKRSGYAETMYYAPDPFPNFGTMALNDMLQEAGLSTAIVSYNQIILITMAALLSTGKTFLYLT